MRTSLSKISIKVYFIILILSFLWVALILLAPLFYSLGGYASDFGSFIYIMFSKTCHQEDSRSFQIFGYKLAVCSRCSVIYFAFLISVVVYPFIRNLDDEKTPSIWILLIPAFLIGFDVLLDLTGIRANSFLSRTVTGFLLGFVLPFFLIPGFINFSKGFIRLFFRK